MCCLYGMMDYKKNLTSWQKTHIISVLSAFCEARGTDATGIAYQTGGRLHIYKRPVAAHRMRFRIPEKAYLIMGHTRMTTQGSAKRNYNNHPFRGRIRNNDFALAHNGVLQNDVSLRKKKHLPKSKIQTDSYVAVQLLEQNRALDLNSLKEMAEQVEGSFAFTVMDVQNNLYFVKGDNPLCIYHYPKTGMYLYASTEEILQKALDALHLPLEKAEKINVSCGELLKIDSSGNITRGSFCNDHLKASYYNSYATHPWSWRCGYDMAYIETYYGTSYIEELKSVAGAFGYCADDVEHLLEEGFTPEELEDYFYGCEC